MVQPEAQLELARRLFESYCPIVEERFDVGLSGYLVKDAEGYVEDMLPLWRKSPPEHERPTEKEMRRELLASLDGISGRHLRSLRSIYVVNTEPAWESHIARMLAHELGHAAHYTLMDEGRAKTVEAEPLGMVVREGLAELVEHEVMAPHYGDIEDIDIGLANGRENHERGYRDVRGRLRLPKEVFLPSPKGSIARLEKLPHYEKLIARRLSRLERSAYALGYVFFCRALDAGIPLGEVLRSPPDYLTQAVAPDLYIAEMMS